MRCLDGKQRSTTEVLNKKKLPEGSFEARLERFELPTL